MRPVNAYVMFSDVKHFSKLNEGQGELQKFFAEVWPEATQPFAAYQKHFLAYNTWGDAVFLVFESPDVVKAILAFRDYFRTTDFSAKGLPPLAARIACHFGSFQQFNDPVTGRSNAGGTHINTAARMEPVTRPNEIFVSDAFRRQLLDTPTAASLGVTFDRLGELELAKGFGVVEAHRLRRAEEGAHIIDRLVRQDLIDELPDVPDLTLQEDRELKKCARMTQKEFKAALRELKKRPSVSFRLGVAGLCKDKGLYEEAVRMAESLETTTLKMERLKIYPLRRRPELLKMKADALTRLGQYQDAAEIVYDLWKGGQRDSDTLSMLAAQYKRRALHNDAGGLRRTPDAKLLACARDLYLEAFRRNLDDSYPAINAAYLCVLLGAKDTNKGRTLAGYILATWTQHADKDWWLCSTLAEAHLLQQAYDTACALLKEAFGRCKPTPFQLETTRAQVALYRRFVGGESDRNGATRFEQILADRMALMSD